MAAGDDGAAVTAIRGAMLTFTGDPFSHAPRDVRRYESDAIVVMARGRIVDCGPAADVATRLPAGTAVTHYANALISAGFIDAHVHYPQLQVIGAAATNQTHGAWFVDLQASNIIFCERASAGVQCHTTAIP